MLREVIIISIIITLQIVSSVSAETWPGEPDCSSSPSSCHYIRKGASGAGNGSNWTDAWDDLDDATFIRGHTYFVAYGTGYTGRDFNTAASGSTYIYIKKAISTDHGTSTGWSSSYGDGQAAVDNGTISVLTDYWVFDGQNGEISDGDDETAYGFIMKRTSTSSDMRLFGIPNIGDHSYDPDYIKIAHWAFVLPGASYSSYVQTAIYSNTQGGDCVSGINTGSLIKACYFKNSHTHIGLYGFQDLIIEDCWFDEIHDNVTHEQHFATNNSDNMTVRNNYFYHPYLYAWGAHGELCATTNSDAKFYGNIVECDPLLDLNSVFGNADSGTPDVIDNMWVVHNTFINCSSGRGDVFVGNISAGDPSYGYNNYHEGSTGAYYNNNYPLFPEGNVVHDYNAYYDCTNKETESHRIDLSSDVLDADYKPTEEVGEGKTDLGSSYSPDPDGNTRGDDGVYDPGAYEYDSGAGNTISEFQIGGTFSIGGN